jgi:hypothetical protein
VGWVVKQWRLESLERLLADDALEALRAARAGADRDARRARREAERAAREAADELAGLEQLGADLTVTVRRRRAAVREARAAAVEPGATWSGAVPTPADAPAQDRPPEPVPDTDAVAETVPAPLLIPRARRAQVVAVPEPAPDAIEPAAGDEPRRAGRASLRGSGLAELFRVTDARPVAPPATS